MTGTEFPDYRRRDERNNQENFANLRGTNGNFISGFYNIQRRFLIAGILPRAFIKSFRVKKKKKMFYLRIAQLGSCKEIQPCVRLHATSIEGNKTVNYHNTEQSILFSSLVHVSFIFEIISVLPNRVISHWKISLKIVKLVD